MASKIEIDLGRAPSTAPWRRALARATGAVEAARNQARSRTTVDL